MYKMVFPVKPIQGRSVIGKEISKNQISRFREITKII